MDYLIQGKLDNTTHTISYDQLRILYEDNRKEAEESRRITESTYRGEPFFTSCGNTNRELDLEFLLRDPKTAGTRMYYPHGIVIDQSQRRNYYRGENQIFSSSVPSLVRKLKQYRTRQEQELYRLVSDMRIAEFRSLLQRFQHVQEWRDSDILYEPLAQHYGLETGWLDITSDFNTALFFATCYWDGTRWLPLTKKQTEVDEEHQYGMIFHMPSNQMVHRWLDALEKLKTCTDKQIENDGAGHAKYEKLEYPIYRGDLKNVIYPLGFQPFMRCHMQNGYGIYMRNPQPLQEDCEFEKLRFRHSEKLSQAVFDMMKGGELIYPHEGLKEVQFLIDQIRRETRFSEEAFRYALYRSHYYQVNEPDKALEDLSSFRIEGQRVEITQAHPWKLSSGRRKKIDAIYRHFSVQDWYGILVLDRKQIPSPGPYFEPWMLPDETGGEGVKDFKARKTVECGTCIASRNYISLLNTVKYAKLSDF